MNTMKNITESSFEKLKSKIAAKEITVGIIGLGYVGLPLALEFSGQGIKTFGFDVNKSKIDTLLACKNYIEDINTESIAKVIKDKKLFPTVDFSFIKECDAVYICVPTPFTVNKDPDISFILQAAQDISKNMRAGQVIILKSTTFPGTTEKHVKPILDKSGLKAGSEYFLAFSPERIDPGNKNWNTQNTPITVGGISPECTEIAALVTNLAVQHVVKVNSPSVAEMEKLLENIFRSVNIALVNELAKLCDRIGVNIWDVVNAAATKPFGFMPFYPGPGIGGHCILIDPYYLAWMAREYDFETKFINLAAEINESMPFYVKDMVFKEVAKQPITIDNAKILILGMAFKKDVDDLRHSPALKVVELLKNENITNIKYYDPYIPTITIGSTQIQSECALTESLVKESDVVVITTDHSVFDFQMVADNAKVVIDTRNACKNVERRNNIVLLGDGK